MKILNNIIKLERYGGLLIAHSGPYIQTNGIMSMGADVTLRETVHTEFSLSSYINKIAGEELKQWDGKYVKVTLTIDEVLRDGYYVEADNYTTGEVRSLFLCDIGKEDTLNMLLKKLAKNKKYRFYKIVDGSKEILDIKAFMKPDRKESKNADTKRRPRNNKTSKKR